MLPRTYIQVEREDIGDKLGYPKTDNTNNIVVDGLRELEDDNTRDDSILNEIGRQPKNTWLLYFNNDDDVAEGDIVYFDKKCLGDEKIPEERSNFKESASSGIVTSIEYSAMDVGGRRLHEAYIIEQ